MPDSLYKLVLNDFNTLSAAALPTWTRVIRKQIRLFERELTQLPYLIIVPLFEAKIEESFEHNILIGYQVGAALIWCGNMQLDTGLGTILDTLETFEEALYVQTLPTATLGTDPGGVFDSEMDLNPPFDVSALPENVDYALRRFTYRAWKNRN